MTTFDPRSVRIKELQYIKRIKDLEEQLTALQDAPTASSKDDNTTKKDLVAAKLVIDAQTDTIKNLRAEIKALKSKSSAPAKRKKRTTVTQEDTPKKEPLSSLLDMTASD